MKNIFVSSVYDVEKVIAEKNITAVLSIEHPDAPIGQGRAPRLDFKAIKQHILCFWDTENQTLQDAPTQDHIKQALHFLEMNKHENILIHCKAGKSRSVAIALSWIAKQTSIENAIEFIKGHRNNPAPNILVVALCDIELGFNGKLYQAVLNDPDFTRTREILRARLKDATHTPDLEKRL